MHQTADIYNDQNRNWQYAPPSSISVLHHTTNKWSSNTGVF